MPKLLAILSAALSISVLSSPADAQVRFPRPGTSERAAILDALRPAVEARLGPNVEFVVKELRTYRGWAFVMANPRRRGGREIEGAAYLGRDWYDLGGLETTAVLQFRNGRWNLIESAIGATDVWYCGVGPRPLLPGC